MAVGCMKLDHMVFEDKDEDLFHVLNLMNEIDCKYWISNGTLLALIRDGKPFSWDHDIDICVPKSEFNYNIAEQIDISMNRTGFKKTHENPDTVQYTKSMGKKIDLNLVQKVFSKDGECTLAQTWRFLHHGESFIKKCIVFVLANFITTDPYKMPRQFLYVLFKLGIYKIMAYENTEISIGNCKKINYFDVECPVPEDVDLFLSELYGKNWRIPEKRKYWFSFAKEKAFDHFDKI